MHGLAEDLLDRGQQHEQLRGPGRQALRVPAKERAFGGNGMDDGPSGRHEDDVVPFQAQWFEITTGPIGLEERNVDHGGHLDQLGVAGIGQAEHQGLAALVRRDGGHVAEDHPGPGSRNPGKDDPRRRGRAQQADQRFEGVENVGPHRMGHDDKALCWARRTICLLSRPRVALSISAPMCMP